MNHKLLSPFFCTTAGRLLLLACVLVLLSSPTLALANQGGGGLPYEKGLKTLTDSITGPVAFGISLVGIVAAGAVLIFGGEMSGFLRTMVFLVLVIAIIVNASGLVTLLGGSAALVGDAVGDRISGGLHSVRILC